MVTGKIPAAGLSWEDQPRRTGDVESEMQWKVKTIPTSTITPRTLGRALNYREHLDEIKYLEIIPTPRRKTLECVRVRDEHCEQIYIAIVCSPAPTRAKHNMARSHIVEDLDPLTITAIWKQTSSRVCWL